jgi:hypothetical protein
MSEDDFNRFVFSLVNDTIEHALHRFPTDAESRVKIYRQTSLELSRMADAVEEDI